MKKAVYVNPNEGSAVIPVNKKDIAKGVFQAVHVKAPNGDVITVMIQLIPGARGSDYQLSIATQIPYKNNEQHESALAKGYTALLNDSTSPNYGIEGGGK